ncbi:hypothetical protein ACIREE_32995 [Streptomyces sp. NPDC102467]|uniref:hypothetical protein n=1 Tax=Streptomyces sp. NPDC102467 TaxID=3366179 RepID=UPI0037F9133C
MNDRREHDEYVSGVRAELTGGYWLDTPGRKGHGSGECRWCKALLKAETAARARRKRPA